MKQLVLASNNKLLECLRMFMLKRKGCWNVAIGFVFGFDWSGD